ncbi:MAG TPA: hypothetical protein VF648_06025 [Pyrinomonadaceae bacterium]|jgi:hypothetical protein
MSVLETPRIIFCGNMSWDPIVTNNYEKFYDEDTSWTKFDRDETVEHFRQVAASSASVMRPPIGVGNWNPHGTHRSNFFDSEISGFDLGGGVGKDDSFVGSPVNFSGMLVDCEPYGSFSSQLFFDQISFGIDGGCRIFAPRKYRFTARYVNFFRLPRPVYDYTASVASVVWQTSFAKLDGLQIDAHDSAALRALEAALDNDEVLGLTVQFNAYSTHYYGAATDAEIAGREQELVNNLAGGGFQPNPARSKIVGVIGLWRKGEPPHEPGDRVMLAATAGPPKFVATAHARLDGNKLTVDLSNSISESDLNETKQNLGLLTFYAKGPDNSIALGTISYSQYDREAYRASAGIVTLNLDASQTQAAATGNLQMQGQDGTVYLMEQALRAIPYEPNLYINFGENRTTGVLVLNKGVPAGSGVEVAMKLDGSSVAQSAIAVTNNDSIAAFNVSGARGQVQGFVLEPNPGSGQASINPQLTTYMYIRTYPGNAAIAELEPTWENVYKYCLSNWNAMAPCMDNWLDLKNEAQVKAYGSILKRLTDPANFESYRFMPVTRDMTQAERKLLYGFLDGDGETSAELEAVPVEEIVNQEELSRQMRQAK